MLPKKSGAIVAGEFQISVSSDRLEITGDTTQTVRLNAEGFFKSLLELPPHRCIDLLQIAAATYAVDRISKRSFHRADEQGFRRLRLQIEVRDVEFWRQHDVADSVAEILRFLTCDDWRFDFVARDGARGGDGHQTFLDLAKDYQPKCVSLYSGGLDSAAGLANRLLDGANDFVIVTVGHQKSLHSQVEKQLSRLTELVKAQTGTTPKLLHSTLNISLEGGKAKRLKMQERTQRSRAFLFCAAAAIAAKAHKVKSMEVFENGVGAINLPLMTGMLGTCLSTRGAHPTFLRLMSDFCSRVTEDRIDFTLPFISQTKGQMLKKLCSSEALIAWVQTTRSCVHTAIRVKGKTHCGICPACIERRQAFVSAGITENMDFYQSNIVQDEPVGLDADYIRTLRREANNWIQGEARTQSRLSDHLTLTDVPANQFAFIAKLQMRHCREVLKVFGHKTPDWPSAVQHLSVA